MPKKTTTTVPDTVFGADLLEAFEEMATHIRGEIELPGYRIADQDMSPARIRQIRERWAGTRKEFERPFGIPSRTLEGYEQRRRTPDATATTLFRIIDQEPEAVARALKITKLAG